MDDYIKRSKALGELMLDYKDIMYIDKQETAARIKKIKASDVIPTEAILKAGLEGKEIKIRINGRLFAIRELAQ